MKKASTKIITLTVLAFLFGNCAQAINSEFKNTLTGVDLTKVGEESYNINLYTSKKLSSPVKVIKKSDLSYYILLPETNNATSQINVISPDIRNINTNLYPYAGVDVHNGYTKININTTKPINFNVTTKSSNAPKTALTSSVASNNTEVPIPAAKEEKIQKKNPELQKTDVISKQSQAHIAQTNKKQNTVVKNNPIKKDVKPSSQNKNSIALAKNNRVVSQKTPAKKETVSAGKQAKKVVQKAQPAKVKAVSPMPQNNVMAAAKIKPKDDFKPEVEPSENSVLENENINSNNSKDLIQNEQPDLPKENTDDLENIQESSQPNVISKKISLGSVFGKFKNIAKSTAIASKNKVLEFNSKFIDKLAEYGLSFGDLLFIVFAGVFTFIAMLFILNRQQNQPRLKSKSDLTDKKESALASSKDENETSDDKGQYFVFEKNIKQNGLLDPATSEDKKNYELISYDPDLRENMTNKVEVDNGSEDMDIIQKILKDDSFIEIDSEGKPQEQTVLTEQKEEVQQVRHNHENVTSPIGQEHVQKETAIQKEDIAEEASNDSALETNSLEPNLLSSEAISPEQGFMLISYKNNISLMGYIFDDVFALHNFKLSKLNNYNIEARLVDKDDSGNVYIVKADGARMLVKVTKTTMSTEAYL